MEIGEDIVSTAILLSTAESSNWWKYVFFVLVNCLGGLRVCVG